MIGTDYGHSGQSAEYEAMLNLNATGLDARIVDKIRWDNPKAFYGL